MSSFDKKVCENGVKIAKILSGAGGATPNFLSKSG